MIRLGSPGYPYDDEAVGRIRLARDADLMSSPGPLRELALRMAHRREDWWAPDIAVAVADHRARLDARRARGTLPLEVVPVLVDTDADPPPLASAYIAPVLRHGPPTSILVGPQKAAHGITGTTLKERAVALVA